MGVGVEMMGYIILFGVSVNVDALLVGDYFIFVLFCLVMQCCSGRDNCW